MIENFVYDGVQVTKTGRTAIKKHPTRGHIIDTLVEISPVDIEAFQWKKWVRENDLFKILDSNDAILVEEK